jgi:hypothetical protein
MPSNIKTLRRRFDTLGPRTMQWGWQKVKAGIKCRARWRRRLLCGMMRLYKVPICCGSGSSHWEIPRNLERRERIEYALSALANRIMFMSACSGSTGE